MQEDSLSDVSFLSRSRNRAEALATLADGALTRTELEERVGISRVTAKRILDGFRVRGWVEAEDGRYRMTPLGDVLATEFEELLETVTTVRTLSAVLPWLPTEFDVDLRRIEDVRVTLPSRTDSVAPIRRSAELMRGARTVRGLATGVAPEALRANRNCVVESEQSFEVVFSADVLDLIRSDPTMSALLGEILEAGGRVYSHDGVACMLGEVDRDLVVLGLTDETGVPRAVVESRDASVRRWFEGTFKTHLAAAERVEADDPGGWQLSGREGNRYGQE
jgi:predicted transcriptional regulator